MHLARPRVTRSPALQHESSEDIQRIEISSAACKGSGAAGTDTNATLTGIEWDLIFTGPFINQIRRKETVRSGTARVDFLNLFHCNNDQHFIHNPLNMSVINFFEIETKFFIL